MKKKWDEKTNSGKNGMKEQERMRWRMKQLRLRWRKKLGKYDIKIETVENERKKNIERTRGRKKGWNWGKEKINNEEWDKEGNNERMGERKIMKEQEK